VQRCAACTVCLWNSGAHLRGADAYAITARVVKHGHSRPMQEPRMRTARGHTCMVLSAACMQELQCVLRTLEVVDDRICELVAMVATVGRLFFHACPLVARRIMFSQVLDRVRDDVQVRLPPCMTAMHSLVTVQSLSAVHMAAHVAAELRDCRQLQLKAVQCMARCARLSARCADRALSDDGVSAAAAGCGAAGGAGAEVARLVRAPRRSRPPAGARVAGPQRCAAPSSGHPQRPLGALRGT
jgi:hypothetical protein